jgi:hypothetical protein
LTSTLRAGKTVNPYHLIRDNVPIDKTHHLFGLDEVMLSANIPIYADIDSGTYQDDGSGNTVCFRLSEMEIRRLLGVSMFWDAVCI